MADETAMRQKVHELAKEALSRNDPAGWFEPLYSWANGNPENIPWADSRPNPHLVEWLGRERPDGSGKRAVVVGCGLGDDVNELLKHGFDVTGFDISSTAVNWARRRFQDLPARFVQADLFNPPAELQGPFDFVFEAYTVQALPHDVRRQALSAVASLVAPGGSLLLVCRARNEDDDTGNLPWPLTRNELKWVEDHGLQLDRLEDFVEQRDAEQIRRFRALFVAP